MTTFDFTGETRGISWKPIDRQRHEEILTELYTETAEREGDYFLQEFSYWILHTDDKDLDTRQQRKVCDAWNYLLSEVLEMPAEDRIVVLRVLSSGKMRREASRDQLKSK